jgi:hypothetical protein
MPDLSAHQSGATTKLLLLGDSGAGKTGSLASLAGAGYNLRIIDMDNGVDVLANILRDPKSQYGREALARVKYATITDKMKNVGGRLVPKEATAWQRAINLLIDWKIGDEQLGPLTTWGTNDVLVLDSLTFMSTAAMNFQLAMNARLGQQPHQSDWYVGQQMIEGLLQTLYDEGVKCNVIVMAHVAYIGEENAPQTGYPSTLGKALPPKVGRYFNSTLLVKTVGQGTNAKRMIHTSTINGIELKNSAPTLVEKTYPLETGLASYFKAVRGA